MFLFMFNSFSFIRFLWNILCPLSNQIKSIRWIKQNWKWLCCMSHLGLISWYFVPMWVWITCNLWTDPMFSIKSHQWQNRTNFWNTSPFAASTHSFIPNHNQTGRDLAWDISPTLAWCKWIMILFNMNQNFFCVRRQNLILIRFDCFKTTYSQGPILPSSQSTFKYFITFYQNATLIAVKSSLNFNATQP